MHAAAGCVHKYLILVAQTPPRRRTMATPAAARCGNPRVPAGAGVNAILLKDL
jgi:hypothetical protein